MASGNIAVTTSNRYISGRLAWSSTTDTANNRSTVTATLYLSRTNTGYTTLRTPNITITINGNKKNIVASSQSSFTYNSNTNCGSHSVVVPHNADGSKSCTISVSGSLVGSTNYSITTASQTVSLDKIPRYPHISLISTEAIGRDRVNVRFFSDSICDYWWYSLNNGSTWTGVGSINSSTAVTTITGLSANTTYNITVRIRRKDSQLTTSHTTTPVKTLSIASPNTPTVSSRTCIQAVMNWSSNRTVTALQYRLAGGAWKTAINFSARTSGSFTITGLTPNYTRTVSIRVKDAVHGTWSSASGNRSLTTHRLTTAGAPTFSTGNSFTVALSRGTTSISNDVTLQMWADSQKWIDIATVAQRTTSVTFNLTATQLNTIYNNRTGSKTSSTRLKIVNRWGHGGTSQGTSYSSTGTCTIVNANPTIASVSYKDINTTIQGILNDNQKILRGKSTLRVTAGRATSQKGATLKSYKVSIGGGEYTVNTSGTSETGKVINVGTINQSSNQTATLTVTDSRGYTASRSFTVKVLNYVAPQFIRNSADRLNNYEEPTTLNVQARRTVIKPSTSDINTIRMRYRVKENPSGAYGSYITLNPKKTNISGIYQNTSVSQYMADYPTNKSYTVEIGLSDRITGWITRTVTLSEGIAMMKFTQNKVSVGVNMDVNGRINATDGVHFVDTRSVSEAPEDLPSAALSLAFKYRKSVGNPPVYASSNYANIIRVVGWHSHEGSGGWPTEMSVGGNGIAVRQATSATAWGSWKKLSVDGHTHNYASSSHNHSGANITSGTVPYARLPVGTGSSQVARGNHSHAWSAITSKPSTFAPSSHTHSYLPLSGGTTTGTTALGNGKLRVYTTGSGEIRIDNNAGNSTDVTIRPSITDRGNVGTSNYRFDVVRGRVMSSSSNRSSKENINIFDEETAYEQIKDIPIYSFSFEHDSYVDHNIGTMIEYMPVEMLETGKEMYVKPGEEKMYSLNNAIFYLMAGFKVAQRKIEDLEEENRDLKSRLERLEEIVLGEEI